MDKKQILNTLKSVTKELKNKGTFKLYSKKINQVTNHLKGK